METRLRELIEHYIRTEDSTGVVSYLTSSIANLFSKDIDLAAAKNHLSLSQISYATQNRFNNTDATYSSNSQHVITQRKLHLVVDSVGSSNFFRQYRHETVEFCRQLFHSLWEVDSFCAQKSAHDDYDRDSEDFNFKQQGNASVESSFCRNNNENGAFGNSSFSLFQSRKGVPRTEIENIVGLIISDGISLSVRLTNIQKLIRISPSEIVDSWEALDSLLGQLNFILREPLLFDDTMLLLNRILELPDEMPWLKCSLSLSRVTLSVLRNDALPAELKRRFIDFIRKILISFPKICRRNISQETIQLILWSFMDLINAEVVGNSSTANPILSFPPNGFITGLASIDTPARWIDHWLYSTYVRSIIFPKLTEFLAEVIAHFNALNIELDHLNKFAGGSRKQSTSKSIRDQCFIASVLLRSLKFSDILFHLYNYLGAEHVSVALIAILRFFYGVNNRIKSKEVMDVFIETALNDVFSQFFTGSLPRAFSLLFPENSLQSPTSQENSPEKNFIKLTVALMEGSETVVTHLDPIILQQIVMFVVSKSKQDHDQLKPKSTNSRKRDNNIQLVALMNDMMRRVSPEKFAAKFTANNVNFLNIALSTLQNAGSTLSNEHLFVLLCSGFQCLNSGAQIRAWKRTVNKHFELNPLPTSVPRSPQLMTSHYFFSYKPRRYLLPMMQDMLNSEYRKNILRTLLTLLSVPFENDGSRHRNQSKDKQLLSRIPQVTLEPSKSLRPVNEEARISRLTFLRQQVILDDLVTEEIFMLITQPHLLLNLSFSLNIVDLVARVITHFETQRITRHQFADFFARLDCFLVNLDLAMELRNGAINLTSRLLQAIKKSYTVAFSMDPLQTSIPIVDELVYRIFEFFSHSIIATEFERWHPNDHNFDQLVDVLDHIPESLYQSNNSKTELPSDCDNDSDNSDNNEGKTFDGSTGEFRIPSESTNSQQEKEESEYSADGCVVEINENVDEFETVPLYRSDLLFNESSDDPASFLLDAFRQQAHGKKIDPFSLIQEFVGSVPNNGSQASKNQPTFKSTPVLNTKMCGDGWLCGIFDYSVAMGLAERHRVARIHASKLRFLSVNCPDWFIATMWLSSGLDATATVSLCERILEKNQRLVITCFWPAVCAFIAEPSSTSSVTFSDNYFSEAIATMVFPVVCQYLFDIEEFHEVITFLDESELPSLLNLLCFYTAQAYLGILSFNSVKDYLLLSIVGGAKFQALHFLTVLLHLSKKYRSRDTAIYFGSNLLSVFLRPKQLVDFYFARYAFLIQRVS